MGSVEQLAPQSISAFGQYGLPGLVILFLFVLIVYVLMQIKVLLTDHNARINSIVEAHCEERAAWMQSLKDNTSALQKLVEQTVGCTRSLK